MSDRILLATFEHEEDLLAATGEVRQRGYKIVDAFTPYAIHGLDQAMGLKPSRLTWVCFICGMVGALGMLWFEYWVGALAWAIDVGGKPWNSLPSNVPVAFETAVLLAGFGSVFALLAVSRLYPSNQASPLFERVTDDRFVLVLEEADALFDVPSVETMLKPFNLLELEEKIIVTGGIE
ncbi:MAG: DUF3341 domain-containing protein [Pirellulales bacterium]|nr:DUF3341 domain-containing protein [Pirellulales bacterium]